MSLQSIFFSPQRGFRIPKYDTDGNVITNPDNPDQILTQFFELDGVIEEQHQNVIQLTQHPIEYGTQITDHAIRQPLVIRVQGIITNSPSIKQLWNAIPGFTDYKEAYTQSFTNERIRTAYLELIKLQNKRLLMTLQTGLLNYENMVMTKVSTPSNLNNNLMLDLTFTEAILTNEEDTESDKGYQLTTTTSDENFILMREAGISLGIAAFFTL